MCCHHQHFLFWFPQMANKDYGMIFNLSISLMMEGLLSDCSGIHCYCLRPYSVQRTAQSVHLPSSKCLDVRLMSLGLEDKSNVGTPASSTRGQRCSFPLSRDIRTTMDSRYGNFSNIAKMGIEEILSSAISYAASQLVTTLGAAQVSHVPIP